VKSFILSIVLVYFQFFGQKEFDISGTYHSVNNRFEKWSIMELNKNGSFKYNYGLGGCQGIITGTYRINNWLIYFVNDKEFTKEYLKAVNDSISKIDSTFVNIGTPIMPDLSLTEWKIKNNAIKPISEIDCGCIIEKGKHIKK